MSGSAGMQRAFERWPKYKDAYLKAFAKMVKERESRGLMKEPTRWHTSEEVMDWWLYRKKEEDLEPGLFDDFDIED